MLPPGFSDRAAHYDAISRKYTPSLSHYYLGVIGTNPVMHGHSIGMLLLRSFYGLSASDPLSNGVYLETANPLNVRFYERAGFAVTGQGRLGTETLWYMFLPHRPRPEACHATGADSHRMVSPTAQHQSSAFISLRHLGFVANEVEDIGSEAVRASAPAYESCTFMPASSGTRVVLDHDVPETWKSPQVACPPGRATASVHHRPCDPGVIRSRLRQLER